MNWIPLQTEAQLHELREKSNDRPQVIFKHSTRCGISSLAKGRLERSGLPGSMDFYYLDLISYRSLSNRLADIFKVPHESPQILLIKNGQCIYNESHTGIRMEDIMDQASAA